MATILLTWELGGGLGHLVNLRPFAQHLLQSGHRVYAALRDLSRAREILGSDVQYVQAPIRTRTVEQIDPPHTFAHLLHNVAFSDDAELATLCEAWRHLYNYVDPDLIVFDHSPAALLAASGHHAKRVLVGTGFFCPPPVYPLPDLRSPTHPEPQTLRDHEDQLLGRLNRTSAHWNQPPLARLADLYAQADLNVLATFPELDHYPMRTDATYFGAWSGNIGRPFDWPAGSTKRIYAYLKPFAALPALLQALKSLAHPTLVYVDGIKLKLQRQFACDTLRFERFPLDLEQAGRECDLAILNANHGTTVAMLRAGKPILQIPLHLEQSLLAAAVASLGAGLAAPPNDDNGVAQNLKVMLETDRFTASARAFSRKYAAFDADAQLASIMTDIDVLLEHKPLHKRLHGVSANAVTESVDPLSLLHPNRFDLLAKHIYARHHLLGDMPDYSRRIYLEHIRVFNGFYEHDPRKDGSTQFLESFENLIDSIKERGYDPSLPAVPVGSDGALLNGAHRVAACLAMKCPVRIERHLRPGYDFSATWFRRWKRFVSTGLPTWCADAMALELCRLCPKAHLILILSATRINGNQLTERIRSFGAVIYGRRLAISETGLEQLRLGLCLKGGKSASSDASASQASACAFLLRPSAEEQASHSTEQLAILSEQLNSEVYASRDSSQAADWMRILFQIAECSTPPSDDC